MAAGDQTRRGVRGRKITAFRDWLLAKCEVRDAGFGTPCWLWTKETLDGYAKGYIPTQLTDERKRKVRVHRAAYKHLVGPIPDGLQLDHLCRNPSCCNPDHLEPVTPSQNIVRRFASKVVRGSIVNHCRNGHEFTASNTLITNEGWRRCRICRNAYMRAWSARKAA
jgi:hypothetical protein